VSGRRFSLALARHTPASRFSIRAGERV